MQKLHLHQFVLLVVCAGLAMAPPAGAITINEIRTTDGASDLDEYFELAGVPGASLDGICYLTIGDSGLDGDSGRVEGLTVLTGFAIAADGLFALADLDPDQCPGQPDATLLFSLPENDNVTHLLVRNCTAMVGDDLDLDDDGLLDAVPWDEILDCVALIDDLTGGELVYCDTQVGPSGTNAAPAHVLRCGSDWYMGQLACDDFDSAGLPNSAACEVIPSADRSWGVLKSLYR